MRQNSPLACSHAAIDRLVRDLLLAEHGVRGRELEAADERVRAGRDDDRRLAGRVDGDQRHAGRLVGLAQVELDARLAEPGERLVGERVAADRADERHPGAEPRAGDGLVRALAAGEALERRAGDRLAGPRQRRAARRRGRG